MQHRPPTQQSTRTSTPPLTITTMNIMTTTTTTTSNNDPSETLQQTTYQPTKLPRKLSIDSYSPHFQKQLTSSCLRMLLDPQQSTTIRKPRQPFSTHSPDLFVFFFFIHRLPFCFFHSPNYILDL